MNVGRVGVRDPISTPARRRRLAAEVARKAVRSIYLTACDNTRRSRLLFRSARAIQMKYRMHRAQVLLSALRAERRRAKAIVIQCWLRSLFATRLRETLRAARYAYLATNLVAIPSQRLWRGRKARHIFRTLLSEHRLAQQLAREKSCRILQRVERGRRARRCASELRAKRTRLNAIQLAAALKIQSLWRSRRAVRTLIRLRVLRNAAKKIRRVIARSVLINKSARREAAAHIICRIFRRLLVYNAWKRRCQALQSEQEKIRSTLVVEISTSVSADELEALARDTNASNRWCENKQLIIVTELELLPGPLLWRALNTAMVEPFDGEYNQQEKVLRVNLEEMSIEDRESENWPSKGITLLKTFSNEISRNVLEIAITGLRRGDIDVVAKILLRVEEIIASANHEELIISIEPIECVEEETTDLYVQGNCGATTLPPTSQDCEVILDKPLRPQTARLRVVFESPPTPPPEPDYNVFATVLQKWTRRHLARLLLVRLREHRELMRRRLAAIRLETAWRRYNLVRKWKKAVEETLRRAVKCVTLIQSLMRRRVAVKSVERLRDMACDKLLQSCRELSHTICSDILLSSQKLPPTLKCFEEKSRCRVEVTSLEGDLLLALGLTSTPPGCLAPVN